MTFERKYSKEPFEFNASNAHQHVYDLWNEVQRCYSEISKLENIVRAQLHGIKYYQWLNDKTLEVDDDV